MNNEDKNDLIVAIFIVSAIFIGNLMARQYVKGQYRKYLAEKN